MATVPKTAAITTTHPAQSSRSVGPATRVASVSTSQVDALNEGTNISFDAAASNYQQEQTNSHLGGEGGRRQRYVQPGVNRLFTADTQAFARIFEATERDGRDGETSPAARRAAGTTVSKIISTYENNALVISGEQPIRGTSISFSL